MKKKTNPYYESIKCKYCRFRDDNRCTYHTDIKGRHWLVSNDDLCKDFQLSGYEQHERDVSPTLVQRRDGSYIMALTPDLYDGIMEYRKYQKNVKDTNELMFVWLIVGIGLIILWLIFGPFIIGIIDMITGIFDFLS